MSGVEMELTDTQEDMFLTISVSATLPLSSGERFQRINIRNSKGLVHDSFLYFLRLIVVNLYFSVMNFANSKYCTIMTNERLEELIRTALTTYRPNFQKLVRQVQD